MHVETLAERLGRSRCSLNDKLAKNTAANPSKKLLEGKEDPGIIRCM